MKPFLVSLTFLLITTFSFSQRIKIKTGNLKSLKGINQYNVIFNYSNLDIVNYKSEAEFLDEKVALREKQKKGRGTKYKQDWFSNRKLRYEPFFEKYFNGYFIKKRKIIISQNNTNAKYTILVDSKLLDPGYINNTPAKVHAYLWVIITVFETNNPENIIFSTKKIKTRYGNYDFNSYNTGNRIAKVYGLLGERLAHYFRKKT